MSLDWNLEEIQGHKNLCWIETEHEDKDPTYRMNPVTEVLIFATMTTGIGTITEENWTEFYARFKTFERLDGPFLVKGDGSEWLIEPSDIENHVGLSTNAGWKDKSRSQWFKDHVQISLDSYKNRAKRETANK